MSQFTAAGFSEAGRGKPNQDSFLIEELGEKTFILAIADGMGGKLGGDIASKIAMETLSKEVKLSNFSIPSIFSKVKTALDSKAAQSHELQEMGTTLTVAIIQNNIVSLGHVGDTRLYHLRNSGIVARTADQTEVQKLIDDGILSKQRAKSYNRRNILLSVLTPRQDFTLQESHFELQKNDRLLLLTDGAYSLASKIELRDLSLKNNELLDYLNEIRNLIESKKIHDDYSVVTFQINN
ncbi:PP2C family protein-serine/threonine phosphatase [Enterovibrio norvegicus]|uniref:PP2C family protein-serine/threonine phosphatase n=1 Tax=Enterovibrio norvegicus TaxID=188144 RepID=UPI00354CB662